MSEWTQEKINRVVKEYIKETLANDEKCRSMPRDLSGKSRTLDGMTFLEASDMKADEARSMLAIVNQWIQNQDHRIMKPVVNRLAKGLPEDSDKYMELSRELLLAFQSILGVRIKRSEGDYAQPNDELIPLLKEGLSFDTEHSEVVSKISPGAQKSPVFTEVQERYVEEIEKGDSWTEKTKHESLAIFELFVQANGDLTIDAISRQLMNEYKSTLMKLPPNMRRKKEYKDKTVQEVLAMGELPRTLSVNTINKHISRLSGLFNWAVHNGYMPTNPATGMQISQSKRRRRDADRQSNSCSFD